MCKFLSCFFYKSKLSFCNNLLSYIGLFLIYFFISLIKKLIRVNENVKDNSALQENQPQNDLKQ